MHRLFGKAGSSSAAPAPTTARPEPDAAPEELREALRLVELREEHCSRLIAQEIDAARKHSAANDKKQALEAIKRKKLHEKERDRLATSKLNLIEQEHTLMALRFHSVVVDAQERGAAAIERAVKKVKGPEGVERVHDRVDDALADGHDVLEASGRAVGQNASMDDDECMEELLELERMARQEEESKEQRALEAELTAVVTETAVEEAPRFAQVPRTVPAVSAAARRAATQREEEERELAELAAGMRLEMPMPMPQMAACC